MTRNCLQIVAETLIQSIYASSARLDDELRLHISHADDFNYLEVHSVCNGDDKRELGVGTNGKIGTF